MSTLFGAYDDNLRQLESLLNVRIRNPGPRADGRRRCGRHRQSRAPASNSSATLIDERPLHLRSRREDRRAARGARMPTVDLRDSLSQRRPDPHGRQAPHRARSPRTSAAISTPSISTTSCSASARRARARPISRWRRPSAYLLAKKVSRIVLARPAVEAGEKLGFLPGDLQEKVNPYLRPLYDALYDMLDVETRRAAARARRDRSGAARVHARPHAERRVRDPRRSAEHHLRADEDVPDARSASARRPSSPATSRRSICRPGGCRASSRRWRSSASIEGIAFVYFDERDVVRHKLVQAIVKAYDAYGSGPSTR